MKLNNNKLTISKSEWIELGKKFAKTKNVEKIKLAQLNNEFEDEGADVLETPERTEYEAEQNYNLGQYKNDPPYMLPEIADKMRDIVNVISSQITQEGVELLVEFKDKKLYTIIISPYRK